MPLQLHQISRPLSKEAGKKRKDQVSLNAAVLKVMRKKEKGKENMKPGCISQTPDTYYFWSGREKRQGSEK
jgi:hypothetical protein